jgi:hypothetical protein
MNVYKKSFYAVANGDGHTGTCHPRQEASWHRLRRRTQVDRENNDNFDDVSRQSSGKSDGWRHYLYLSGAALWRSDTDMYSESMNWRNLVCLRLCLSRTSIRVDSVWKWKSAQVSIVSEVILHYYEKRTCCNIYNWKTVTGVAESWRMYRYGTTPGQRQD